MKNFDRGEKILSKKELYVIISVSQRKEFALIYSRPETV